MMSPYRDPTVALEAKLRALLESRKELDASIAETRRELEPRREARRRERGGAALAVGLVSAVKLALLVALVVASLPSVDCGGCNRSRDSQTRALVIRSASEMYLADQPGNTCPDVGVLVKYGFLNASTRTTDEWDRPFVIECDGVDVTARSAGPDGQHGTEDDIE